MPYIDIMKKNELVVKSNRLVEASYRLGLNEQRIILYAISRCREEQKGLFPDLPITITADNFLKQFPSVEKGSVYGQLKEAMNSLYNRSVTIHDIDNATQKARVRETRWISEKAYIDGAGHIQIVFTPEVIKYITRLEVEFTSYQLEKVGNMTSAYAVRIYELLAQHRDIGSRILNLKWLRETLQVSQDEYKLTADFKKWVVEVAVDQINKHSDLAVSYKPIKTGRAITDFAFKIKDKGRKAKATNTPADQAYRSKLEANGQQRIPDGKKRGVLMATVTISEAARLVGVSRKTIQRHISSGKLSATLSQGSDTSTRQLDISELIRVYGKIDAPMSESSAPTVHTVTAPNDALAQVIEAQKETIDLLKKQVDELTVEKKELRTQVAGLLEYRKPIQTAQPPSTPRRGAIILVGIVVFLAIIIGSTVLFLERRG